MDKQRLSSLSDKSLKSLMTKLLFLLLAVMIVSHVVVFVIFTYAHRQDQSRVNRELMVQQVLHLVRVVQTSAPNQRASVVNKIDIPNIDLEIDKTPEYKAVFTTYAMWPILEYVSRQHKQIQLSINLGPHQWLNLDAQIVLKSWFLQILLFVLEFFLAVGVLFYLWSINRFIGPLRQFTLAAKRLGEDLHASALPETGPSDVRKAARAMNHMQEKLRSFVRDRTQMLAAISHDLRTPITRLKLRSQFIQDETIRDKNIHDCDEMEAMIADTLNFAKLDSQRGEPVRLEFASLLTSVCDDLNDVHGHVHLQPIQRKLIMHGRPLSLKRALNNVIENALKYGHEARVSVHLQQQNIVITVDDKGPGIDEACINKVFSPFFRTEASRSRNTGGAGLGLAVARDVMRMHGGDVALKNKRSGGLRVIMTLPQSGELHD